MNRKTFIKKSAVSCLTLALIGMEGMSGCVGSAAVISIPATNNELIVPKSHFIKDPLKGTYHRSVQVRSTSMEYPIVLYRLNEDTFRALLLRCTHQGTSLQVYGDLIDCPAHGSEFDSEGGVITGPASRPLTSYPVRLNADSIIITLS